MILSATILELSLYIHAPVGHTLGLKVMTNCYKEDQGAGLAFLAA